MKMGEVVYDYSLTNLPISDSNRYSVFYTSYFSELFQTFTILFLQFFCFHTNEHITKVSFLFINWDQLGFGADKTS